MVQKCFKYKGKGLIICMTEEEELLAYLNVVAAENSKAIPGKDTFTFISKLTGIPQVFTLDAHGKPKQVVEFDDRVMSAYHSPDGSQTVIGMDHGGNEKQQFYLLNEGDERVEELVIEPEYFHHFGGWSPDGKQISFSANRRHPGYFDVFTLDVETKEEKKVFEYDGNVTPVCWLPCGKKLIMKMKDTNIDSTMYIVDIASGTTEPIGNVDVSARYDGIEITQDGKTAYVLTDAGEETLYIGKVSLDEPSHVEKIYGVDGWDIVGLSLSPNNETIAYTINVGGIYKMALFNIKENTHTDIHELPIGVFESISWLNDNTFVFTAKTPTIPGDCYTYSLDTKFVERKTSVGKSPVEDQWLEPKLYSYQSFDGLEVPYFLYDATDGEEENKPAVLFIHGGPEGQTKAIYNPVIQYLASKGFAVAAPNVRGSRGYGRAYIQLDDARKRMDSVKDLESLVDDLVENRSVDRGKVGIIGRSYGGFMVLAALTHFPDIWAAGVNIVGISHFRTFLENTGAWRRRLRECEYGTLADDTDFFEEIAPLNHSDKIKAPLLIFHGRNDTRVPVSEAEQLAADMKERGQDVELTIFENEGHQTEKIENHITQHTESVAFFKKHLH
ncbi:MAG TPA: S9 family peptidase [Bacillota bacterium]|nr:S9 family peptidase [Bacillota bacterium]